jgi:hypothetical protein
MPTTPPKQNYTAGYTFPSPNGDAHTNEQLLSPSHKSINSTPYQMESTSINSETTKLLSSHPPIYTDHTSIHPHRHVHRSRASSGLHCWNSKSSRFRFFILGLALLMPFGGKHQHQQMKTMQRIQLMSLFLCI